MKKAGPQSSISNKTHLYKKKQVELYSKVDKEFLESKPKDPYKFIDKKTQKIEINPGIPYVSTSQDAVFEVRNALASKSIGRQTNQFIALPHENEGTDSDTDEGYLTVKPRWEPPQLKNHYKPVAKVEFEIDEDDEDALIL